MQSILVAKHLLLLAAALTATAVRSVAAQGLFDSVAVNASCAAQTVSAAARGEIECAMRSSESDTSRSFSFINGVCVVSDSPDCAVSGPGFVFRKRLFASLTSQGLGYVQQIGDIQFWVFQQRRTGQVQFNRTWVEYEQGFGNNIDFWVGLRQINNFTKWHNNSLRIEATTVEGKFYFAEWLNFTVADASTSYTMNCGPMTSSNLTGDAMSTSRGKKFSTKDADNDEWSSDSCSLNLGSSGFWFGNCMDISPNGWFAQSDNSMGCRFMDNFKALNFVRMMLQI